nr:hypothetical protein Iba_chr04aCG0970 [Ipomoea batatas]
MPITMDCGVEREESEHEAGGVFVATIAVIDNRMNWGSKWRYQQGAAGSWIGDRQLNSECMTDDWKFSRESSEVWEEEMACGQRLYAGVAACLLNTAELICLASVEVALVVERRRGIMEVVFFSLADLLR